MSIAQANGADVVLSGHAHLYDRFGKLDADGQPSESGMRSFVVGAGGRDLSKSVSSPAGLEAVIDTHHGVLRMDLRRESFAWQFVSSDDGAILDSGEASCTP
jgi:hypothetical protein